VFLKQSIGREFDIVKYPKTTPGGISAEIFELFYKNFFASLLWCGRGQWKLNNKGTPDFRSGMHRNSITFVALRQKAKTTSYMNRKLGSVVSLFRLKSDFWLKSLSGE